MRRRTRTLLCVGLLIAGVASVAAADGPPWNARRVRGMRPNLISTARVAPADWPQEPASPSQVDPARFGAALEELCGWMPPGRPLRYADWILRYSAEFGEDPFLLGALIYTRTLGACRPDYEGPHGGVGLTAIRHDVHFRHLRGGVYTYRVLQDGEWVEREKRMDRFPFGAIRLQRAEDNIYFAAALLSVWREQHASVDEAFAQIPHRHHVSHFVWGDHVRSDRDEDRVFTDRRKLLQYYGAIGPAAPLRRLGLVVGSPLDGAPRVISSGLGSDRDGGDRSHRGIDLESLPGEVVRVLAEGRVIFAGVDLPGRQHNQQMSSPEEYEEVSRRAMGRGGRYVCVLHQGDEGPVRSCYMHLETVEVVAGDELRRGDRIGTVGRTGMRSSAAHLHLEIHAEGRRVDPAEVLDGLVIGDPSPDADAVERVTLTAR